MKKARTTKSDSSGDKIRPALTPEARENQLIALAVNLAEKQLLEGTASSQVITHYLKMGSEKERLERERLAVENRLLEAKTEAIQSTKRSEELMREAIMAFKSYSGSGDSDDY